MQRLEPGFLFFIRDLVRMTLRVVLRIVTARMGPIVGSILDASGQELVK